MRDAEQRAGRQLLRRDERRAQLIRAATSAFAEHGFAATGLDDIARHAGVTKVLIYRHFESKEQLYLAVLDEVRGHLHASIGPPDKLGQDSIRTFVLAARADPEGFRLLFRHAQREPKFADYAEELDRASSEIAERRLREILPETAHRQWVASLLPIVTRESILSWLDAGRPVDEDELVRVIGAVLAALVASVVKLGAGAG